ncbi:MAG: DNA mismatch repair protein MutS [Candidatus Bipolaricaulia bacterium]
MMKQYLRFKADHPDAILFFHLGDFYEAFFEDAEILSRELDIVLTSRNGHPMAGVPIRRGTAYINQLLKKGFKVAVCQQVEDPKKAQGLVKRDVIRIVTPGTVIDESVLDAGTNNYLASVYSPVGGGRIGLSFVDLSTGEFTCTVVESEAACIGEIERRDPTEILLQADSKDGLAALFPERAITELPAEAFEAAVPCEELGVDEAALQAAGAILKYVETTQKAAQAQIRPLRPYVISDHVDLDPFTVSSLELVRPIRDGQERGTLLHVLNRTSTSMGRRRLRRLILAPLTDRSTIEGRLDAVGSLVGLSLVRQELRDRIKDVHDLERLIGRLGAGRTRPHDLSLLLKSFGTIPSIARGIDEGVPDGLPEELNRIRGALLDPDVEELCTRYACMLVDQPPVDPRDGGMIRDGYNAELDRLREETRTHRAALTTLEADEREKTEIPSLKVGYNRVFGYYIEVTKPHLDKVPERYRRRQTLANAERFVTDTLRGLEEKIALGEERAVALEIELFDEAIDAIRGRIPEVQSVSDALAELDVFLGLADTAHRNRYVRPSFTVDHSLSIRAGRHPVVEQVEEFVPNDLELPEGRDLVILTGPNMAGKSVFLRQAALICLMAQIGSFVPAAEARLPIVDRVFARVGASDMLVAGVSTFMMEMLEVAAILGRATAKSLIILDEMGRGTSTFDGVSIAWAVAEELARKTRAKTLFATHYQELTGLADEIPNVVNLHVAVKEMGRDVVFLHRVEAGTAAGSYGVHVARLAGLPDHVTEAAERILDELLAEAPLSNLGPRQIAERLPLFGSADHPVLMKLRGLDPDRMTPLEALQMLSKLKSELD